MAKQSNQSSGKVNDVSKPGETPASPNARPTITGHQPIVKNDPMVSSSSQNEPNEDDKDKSTKIYVNKSKTRINPISEDLKTDSEESSSPKIEVEKTEEKKGEEPDKEEDKTEDKPAAVGSDSAAIDALAQTADSKKAESKQAEEEQKRREYIDGLVKNGKYRLPIIEGGHKASAERVISWIFLLLLIASVGAYLAVDAGYIEIGLDLPFEFIQN